jgi:hypothetical protein
MGVTRANSCENAGDALKMKAWLGLGVRARIRARVRARARARVRR